MKHLGSDAGSSTTGAPTVVGTPAYLAPEAIRSAHHVDARTDVYAVGALAYFLLTGTPVFRGGSMVATIAKHLTDTPDPFERRGRPDVPAALEALVFRCLAKDPAERPADANELRRALVECGAPGWDEHEGKAWWAAYRRAPLREAQNLISADDSTVEAIPNAIVRSSTFLSSRTLPAHG